MKFLKTDIANGLNSLSGYLGTIEQIVQTDSSGNIEHTLDELLNSSSHIKDIGEFATDAAANDALAAPENAGDTSTQIFLYRYTSSEEQIYVFNFVGYDRCIQIKKNGSYQDDVAFYHRIIEFADSTKTRVVSTNSWSRSVPLAFTEQRRNLVDNALRSGTVGPTINNVPLYNGQNTTVTATGGSTLTFTPALNSGTPIGTFDVDGTTTTFYAPNAATATDPNALSTVTTTAQAVQSALDLNGIVRANSGIIVKGSGDTMISTVEDPDYIYIYKDTMLDNGSYLYTGGVVLQSDSEDEHSFQALRIGTFDGQRALYIGDYLTASKKIVLQADDLYLQSANSTSASSASFGNTVDKILTTKNIALHVLSSSDLNQPILSHTTTEYIKLRLKDGDSDAMIQALVF